MTTTELDTITRWGTDEDEAVVFSNDTIADDDSAEYVQGDVVVVDSFPGVWRVNQPVSQGFAHLVAHDDDAKAYMKGCHTGSLIVQSRVCSAYTVVADDSDTLSQWGDLAATVQEARGWLADIGWPGDTASPVSVVLSVLDTHYDGGLGGFALDTVML